MTEFTLPLDIKTLEITKQHTDKQGNIIFDVVRICTKTTCTKCGKPATQRYGYSREVVIQHTSILDRPVYLRIKPVRYRCEHCNDHPTTTEKYPWLANSGKITKALEDFILRQMIHSTIEDVSKKLNISYSTIETAMRNRIGLQVDWSQHADLSTIGIDEISNRKGHQDYLTVVSAKNKQGKVSVLSILDGRKKEQVKTFLETIPEQLKKTVKQVCTDMCDAFINAALEVFGKQKIVVDRYHVAKLYRKPLDKLRIKEMDISKKELSKEEYDKLDGMMWIIRKKHECLTQADKDKLELLYTHSPVLKKAHKYALKLTHIFNTHCKRKTANDKIDRWIKSVKHSELTCFDGFIKTLEKYKSQILNYFKERKNSGFVEGLNNKIKVAKRRCYGLLKTESFFSTIMPGFKGIRCVQLIANTKLERAEFF